MTKELQKPHFCLGTVQFGLEYGVANNGQKCGLGEIEKIFNYCTEKGIRHFDTAQAYGKAEEILGGLHPEPWNTIITTKIKPGTPSNSRSHKLKESLQRLNIKKVETLLIHSSTELTGPGGREMLSWLIATKEKGLATNIGVSIYEGEELESIPLEVIDVIQLPISVYDQRMIQNGQIYRLKEIGKKIQARSVLLQGLLLTEEKLWPKKISTSAKKHHHNFLGAVKNQGLTPIDVCIDFICSIQLIDEVLFGAQNLTQLVDLVYAWERAKTRKVEDFHVWAWSEYEDVDPRAWQ
jgi:aryl-alcohol dehydrogenase-like predicted oxidoreductase